MDEECVHCGCPIGDASKVYGAYDENGPSFPAHMYLSGCIVALRIRIENMEGGKSSNPLTKES